MPGLELLQRALTAEKGYAPLDADLQQRTGLRVPGGLDWVGLADAWGSVASLALVRADGLAAQDIAARAEAFWGLVQPQRAFTGKLLVGARLSGPAEVRLGSFGVLALVFDGGAPPASVQAAQAAKRGSLRDKTHLVAWCVDVPLRKVHGHHGLPLGVHPGRGWLEQVLRRA